MENHWMCDHASACIFPRITLHNIIFLHRYHLHIGRLDVHYYYLEEMHHIPCVWSISTLTYREVTSIYKQVGEVATNSTYECISAATSKRRERTQTFHSSHLSWGFFCVEKERQRQVNSIQIAILYHNVNVWIRLRGSECSLLMSLNNKALLTVQMFNRCLQHKLLSFSSLQLDWNNNKKTTHNFRDQ